MRKCVLMALILLFCAHRASAVTFSMNFEPSQRELVNPYIGSAAWAFDPTPRQQPFTLVFANLCWKDFEPRPGQYAFDAFEEANHFDKWRTEGKRLILRFVVDMPGKKKHMDIPKWLYDMTGRDGKYYKVSYGSGYSPNYANPALLDAHRRAIAALGARYDGDPFVAYVELGSLGHWGEWHVHERASQMPDQSVQEQYAQAYVDAFKTARLMMRRPFRFAGENGLGLYNDMAGEPEATTEWLEWIQSGGVFDQTGEALVAMPTAWQQAPVGGELSTELSVDVLLGEDFDQTLLLFESSHASWIGPGSFVDVPRNGPLQNALDRLNRTIGYRLLVSSARLSIAEGRASLSVTWENAGIAPFYFDWTPCLRLTDATGGQRLLRMEMELQQVLPGAPVTVSMDLDDLPEGAYDVEVSILDPETGEPGVELAMDTPVKSGWHKLLTFRL